MNNEYEGLFILAVIVFGIMFIVHTISDYNLIADTRNFCQQIKSEKHIEVKE